MINNVQFLIWMAVLVIVVTASIMTDICLRYHIKIKWCSICRAIHISWDDIRQGKYFGRKVRTIKFF